MHKKKRSYNQKDWLISSNILKDSFQSINRKRKINRSYDIPYVAGYSEDGMTIYIDRHMPRVLKINGKSVATDRFLILHEAVEKALIDELNLHYQFAHQIALRVEEAAVRASGISWDQYNKQMAKYIKNIGDESITKIPPKLDLKPYHDEKDWQVLTKMKATQSRKKSS